MPGMDEYMQSQHLVGLRQKDCDWESSFYYILQWFEQDITHMLVHLNVIPQLLALLGRDYGCRAQLLKICCNGLREFMSLSKILLVLFVSSVQLRYELSSSYYECLLKRWIFSLWNKKPTRKQTDKQTTATTKPSYFCKLVWSQCFITVK